MLDSEGNIEEEFDEPAEDVEESIDEDDTITDLGEDL